jgi:hypothetical protein
MERVETKVSGKSNDSFLGTDFNQNYKPEKIVHLKKQNFEKLLKNEYKSKYWQHSQHPLLKKDYVYEINKHSYPIKRFALVRKVGKKLNKVELKSINRQQDLGDKNSYSQYFLEYELEQKAKIPMKNIQFNLEGKTQYNSTTSQDYSIHYPESFLNKFLEVKLKSTNSSQIYDHIKSKPLYIKNNKIISNTFDVIQNLQNKFA